MCVNALNKQWRDHCAQHHTCTLTVNGNDKTTIVLHRGIALNAYRTPPGGLYSNAESLKVITWDTKQVKPHMRTITHQLKPLHTYIHNIMVVSDTTCVF